jgi:hypothetical protein
MPYNPAWPLRQLARYTFEVKQFKLKTAPGGDEDARPALN